jgi:hypothetical protein
VSSKLVLRMQPTFEAKNPWKDSPSMLWTSV